MLISEPNLGYFYCMNKKPHSEETKRKISLARKGQIVPMDVRKKMSETSKKNGNGKWMIGKKHSEETREKMRLKRQKSDNPNWKGGITPINHLIRNSQEMKLWREAVFKRDNYTCVWCGNNKGDKQADHIKRFADFPELRFAIDNGRTLCVPCHRTTFYGNRRN